MASIIVFTAQYLYLLIGVIGIITFTLACKTKKRDYLLLSLLAFPLSYIIGKISGFIISDPRPFVVQHIQPLIHASTDNGFPSDHTLLSMTIAVVIFTYNRKIGLLLVLLSLIVGAGRVMANIHHPLDIEGSIIIAIVTTHISWQILRWFKFIDKIA